MTGWKRFWRAETGFFVGIWLALMVVGRTQMFRDPGTFWHTVMGRKMLGSGRLIDADPFSFTFGGQPWIPHGWLSECAMAVVHAVSGLDGLLLATATILATLYTGIAHRLLRSGLHWMPATLILMMTLSVSSLHFHVRPHVASIVMFAVLVAFLIDFESGRIRWRQLGWLIPLFVLWANAHGAVLGGYATLGLAAIGWSFARLIGRESPLRRPRDLAGIWLLVIASGLTSLVNPYGLRLPATWREIMNSPVVSRLIIEHAPPDPRNPEFWTILTFGVAYALAFLSTWPRWPRITWLIPFVWFGLTLSRVRNAPFFGVAAVLALADMLPYTRVASWLARPGRDLYRAPGAIESPKRFDARPWVLPVVLVVSSLGIQVAGVRAPVVGRDWVTLDPTLWPVELLPRIQQAAREHPGEARVFNDYNFGGFLIYYTPGWKVFIDDRCELYRDEWLDQFDRASSVASSQFHDWLEEYQIDFILVHSGSVFDRQAATEPGWTLRGSSPVANFYGRTSRLD